MTVKIMLRMSCRDDVVLTLEPGRFVPVSLRPSDVHGQVTHFSLLLVEDGSGDQTPHGIHLPEASTAVVEQPTLIEVAA